VASRTAASGAATPPPPAPDGLALAVEAFGFAWPGADAPTLRSIALRLAPGECVWLGGASGSGKTTLLRAIAGLLPVGDARGQVRTRGRPALLLQNVETQLLATRVDDELDFGLALRGLPEAERRARAGRALGALGLAGFEARAVDDLSAGEKQRVVLAALLALEPGILLLDEPSSQLDPDGRRRLAECLGELARRGHALLIADHVLTPWADCVDRCLALDKGTLVASPRFPDAAARGPEPRPLAADAPVALAVDGLRASDGAGRETLRGVSLRVAAGERVHLTGRNGAGKSTLLRAVAGLLRPAGGRVRIAGGAAVPGRVGLLFQNPERNLFERSVGDEIAFGLRRLGWPEADVAARVRDVLARCGLERRAGRSPLRLSFGEQHRVALASLLAPRPALLLLDEPFTGLDLESRARVLELLDREQAAAGFGLLVASHDPPPAARWAHRRLALADGRLAP